MARDKELSVWIEIVRYATDKTEYAGDDHRFMLHVFSPFKDTLPMYDRAEADKKFEEDLKWHLEHFNMPAWNRILEKLVHVDEDDGLRVAMEQLMAMEVYSPRPHRVCLELYPEVFRNFKPPPEIDHITMEGMVQVLVDIIYKARKWENEDRGSESAREAWQRMAEMPHVSKLYEQDWEDSKARVGPKTDDQSDFLKSIHKSVRI
ncbi:hypothetical protein JMJ35_000217 [Cladonia borealis]|uniref:Uncharacterized protein n=1 Tax=Cladonia borealis TaxID=184061 RepID=A0AA39V5L6_9LECA|nr:hypothetical protein JMJ35_000217 [Cladonia borealis]